MHKWGDARTAFQLVVGRYQQTPLAVDARNYLSYMQQLGV
jgi:hypothetical protein